MSSCASPLTQVDIERKTVDDKSEHRGLEAWCWTSWRATLTELISTSFLILFGCMSCIPIEGTPAPLYGPLGFGFTVLFNIQIFGHISGAHMNPAVTLAAVLWGKTSIVLGIAYIFAQVLGAIIGYGILVGLAHVDVAADSVCVTTPHHDLTVIQALGTEIMLTAALCFLCCALWDPVNQHCSESNSIKFGLAVAGLSLIGGPLTGASMNPARSLGPALWSAKWESHWMYWVGPFMGSILATIFYKVIYLKRDK